MMQDELEAVAEWQSMKGLASHIKEFGFCLKAMVYHWRILGKKDMIGYTIKKNTLVAVRTMD